MNKLLLCLFFAATSLTASSQKVYYIYLQSESGQPFFAKMNGKVHSSTASGYLILSKLHDSTYSFSIGFPQEKWPEQSFVVTVNKKDHGYLIKNFGEKGWGLFDLQTLAVQMSATVPAKPGAMIQVEDKNASEFTTALSKASNDPSLKEKPVQPLIEEKKEAKGTEGIAAVATEKSAEKKEETKTEMIPAANAEPPLVKKDEVKEETKTTVPDKQPVVTEQPVTPRQEANTEIKEQPIIQAESKTIPEQEYQSSVVTKRSESSTTEGFGLVYIDNHPDGAKDTIRLLIPNPKPVASITTEEPKEEKKFLDIPSNENVKQEEEKNRAPVVNEEKGIGRIAASNNCIAAAEEADFFKLRKIMAAADSEDEMVIAAKKYFKAKCFSTSQVKNLSFLFLKDEGKYQFFDAAYLHTTDPENYSSLQSELKEEYYINRFKAMLRN
jgi:hypothetical protein